MRAVRVAVVGLVPTVLASGIVQAQDDPVSLLLFGSLETGPSTFVSAGAKVALDRIDREGFVALASLGAGTRREGTGRRETATAAAVVGYQWFYDWGVLAAYAGAEGSIEAVTRGGVSRLEPARVGARLHGEVWARPAEATLLTITAILDTSRTAAWGRLSWGWQVEPWRGWNPYLGPELALYADHTGYRKWNLGVHATDFTVGRFSLRTSAGLQFEPRDSASPYVSLTVWTPW
ncbi:cellulose biosynthesis protein BcsS [Methylobacterium sp. Leaf100]|uniref:cellulose biosynthesis protein BcsS n=1 Tax=Methylobacterium sp. Leaf100 TaxID=1736252 RepID=UPI001FCCDC67|nr:cellulose biosynthesis protein BcsS [Methylobacterium sp. Leaf100]